MLLEQRTSLQAAAKCDAIYTYTLYIVSVINAH